MAAYTETLKESAKELFELTQNLVQQGHRKENRIWKNSLTLLYINNKNGNKIQFHTYSYQNKIFSIAFSNRKNHILKTLQGGIKLYKFREE